MSLDIFNAVIQPKVRGTINLHEALLTSPLDFFVMTSSIITAIGTSTQCNYSAANTFLDGMARHRHSLGLPATSIALGMITEVGHVSDHPEVAEALRKNGMHGIDEDEYLRMMELVCRPRNPSPPAWDWDDYATAHIITGLEPGRVSKIQGKTLWLEDNRLRHVKTYLNASSSEHEIHKPSTANATPISRILAETAAQSGAEGVKAAVQDLVLERFSQIVLVPKERLLALPGRPLAELGMDSMVATEVRTWAWRELRVDVPFLRLLEGGRTVGELVGWVQEGVDLGLIEGASKSPALLDYETGTINKK
jgi:hypothetical protein